MPIVTKTLDAIYLGEFGDMSLGFPTGNGFREDLAGSYSADGGTLTELRFRGDEDFADRPDLFDNDFYVDRDSFNQGIAEGGGAFQPVTYVHQNTLVTFQTTTGGFTANMNFFQLEDGSVYMMPNPQESPASVFRFENASAGQEVTGWSVPLLDTSDNGFPPMEGDWAGTAFPDPDAGPDLNPDPGTVINDICAFYLGNDFSNISGLSNQTFSPDGSVGRVVEEAGFIYQARQLVDNPNFPVSVFDNDREVFERVNTWVSHDVAGGSNDPNQEQDPLQVERVVVTFTTPEGDIPANMWVMRLEDGTLFMVPDHPSTGGFADYEETVQGREILSFTIGNVTGNSSEAMTPPLEKWTDGAFPGAEPDGVVDGEDFGENMGVGYDDANAPTDGGGDQITNGADSIEGNGGNDTISGGGGNDTIDGGADDDRILGNGGNDSLLGNTGDDTLLGGGGNDILDGGDGDDSLDGGIGIDTLTGGLGADTLVGGAGDDNLTVASGDVAQGGTGDDVFILDPTNTDGPGTIFIDGGDDATSGFPDDLTNGNEGDVLDFTGLDNVTVITAPVDDGTGSFSGVVSYTNAQGEVVTVDFTEIENVRGLPNPANDIVDGENTGEVMAPGYDDALGATDSGGDIIDGADGIDDVILGNGGGDTINAGLGNDEVYGGSGNDVIDGGAGSDTLTGDFASDVTDVVVDSGTINGDDTISGGDGDDVIYGDSGEQVDIGVRTFDFADGRTQDLGDTTVRVQTTGDVGNGDGRTPFNVNISELPPEWNADGEIFSDGSFRVDNFGIRDQFGNPIDGSSTYIWTYSEPVQGFSMVVSQIDDGDNVGIFARGPDGEPVQLNFTAGSSLNPIGSGTGVSVVSTSNGTAIGNPDTTLTVWASEPVSRIDFGLSGQHEVYIAGPSFGPAVGFEPINTEGGDDEIIGGEGADVMFGEGGDDTFLVGSAAEGAGDVITGGNGPDQTLDNDVLDLRGAGQVTITATDDATDAGAQTGTVTFADGSTLEFSQIETILTDPAAPTPDGVVDGEDAGEEMGVGYDDSNAPTDGGGDLITDEADVIEGNGGDDTINAGGGDDVVDGGGDDDLLDGEAGDDTLSGGVGTDTLIGGEGADVLDGGGDDDDIFVGAGDTALGGSGDDEFYVDPALTGSDPITVIGGETGEDLTDPTNGGDGDVLDLRGLGPVDVTYDETDPTFDPVTGVGESGTAVYTNDAGEPVTINFSEIEDVLTDPQADGVVDGADTPEDMAPGYVDPQGDAIDGPDGLDDTILGNEGDDTIDAGLGDDSVEGGLNDDLIDGNDGNDTLLGNEGNDTIDGGDGNDTLLGGDEADTLTGGAGDDLLEGEDGDDDIAVGGADTANGGLGDDVFTVDPTDLNPDVDVTIDGGSDGTTGDPAGPENGDEGDILDLSDQLGDLEVVLEPNPESGTVNGLDADDTPDITFDEIEIIETGRGDDLIDGTLADGPVVVDGNEGEDTLLGGAGDDTLDGGGDDDLIDGGAGDDSIDGGDGNDTLDGGEGADTLDGGAFDDDITLGAGDTGIGGSGDDEFTIDPTVAGTSPITVIGGEDLEEDVIDPTNNPDGRIGDVLDLTGLGEVDVIYDETDPTFDPVTGVGESGTAIYTNDDGLPVVINFSEIENVLVDVIDQTPVANDDTADVDEDTPVIIDVLGNDTDPNGDPLTVTDATAPNGTVAINPDGTLTYTPDPDFNGDDVITYTVEDPDGNAATGEVAVTVAPVNDAPVAADDAATTPEDTLIIIDVLGNDTDVDGDPLTVIEATALFGTVALNPDGTLDYTPDPDFNGEDTISYTVEDPSGETATAEVAVTITPVDDTPVATDDAADVDEDTPTVIDVLGNDTDPNGDPLTVTDATAPNGTVAINPDGTLTYTPDPDFNGDDVITYTVEDPDGNQDTATVDVTVAPVNDAPVAEDDAATTAEDTPVTIDVLGNDTDVDGDPLTVVSATAPNGTVTINPDGTLEYTPDPDFNGDDVITYTVEDPSGETSTGQVAVTITPVDDTPVANDDTADVDEDTPVIIDVLGNDTDPNGDPLTVVSATAPNGTVTINPDGTLAYTPDPDFNGEDVITYTVEDPDGNAATGEVAVSVAPVNDAPVANDDAADTEAETPVLIDVLANDTDLDNTPAELTVIAADAPNGTVDINPDGTLVYTPDAGFDGVDTITYTVSDPDGLTDTAEVSVTVAAPVDVAPTANPDLAEVEEGTVGIIDVLANDTDPQDDPLTVVLAEAENGIVDINPDGTLSYEPDAGFVGEDTITYTVTDPDGNESTSTVTVTVTPAIEENSAPVAVDDSFDFDIDGYGGGNIRLSDNPTRILENDTDAEGDPISINTIEGGALLNTWVDGDAGGQFRISTDGSVRFRDRQGDFDDVPDGEVVTTSITYTVTDGNGVSNVATISVNVTGAAIVESQTPVAADDQASVTEGNVVDIDVLANDIDPQGDPLTVTAATALNGIVDINPDGTLSYEPDEGFVGEDTITYTITDPDGNTDTAIVTVTVAEGDQTPVANDDTADVDEDTPTVIDVLGNDTDPNGDPLTVVSATAPNGTVTINPDGTLTYTPDPDFNGEDTITYTVEDPDGNAATGEVAVSVAPVNDAPVANDDTADTAAETPVIIDVLGNDVDVDGDPLTVIAADAPNGIVDINPDGTLTYEPDAGFEGVDVITYTITDPSGETSTATVAVEVAGPVEVAPVANDDAADVDEDTPVIIDVLGNDTDPNGDPLTVVSATAPNGTVTINPDGTLTYTPDPDFNGEDTITYTVEDPDGNAATGEVAVSVAPVNDAPVANDDTATTAEDTPVTIDVLGNDTDVDGDPLTVVSATAPNGTVTINPDGTLEYTPDPDFNGDDVITYTVEDPSGETSTGQVAVTITPVDDTPVANDDTADVDEDTPTVIDVLGNDTDPNGDPLTVVSATAPNGTVTINPDGTLEYTPDPDFNGEDVITYTVEDPDGNAATGEVAVSVAPVNDAPVANDDTGVTEFETSVTLDVLANDTDVDGDLLSVIEATANNGTVTINPDGTLEYTPDAGFEGIDTISYTISDGELTDTAHVDVEVAPDNTGGAGPVDGLDTGEVMNPGYTDADGDQIDGDDGLNDEIFGNGGNDRINGGEGNDTIDGGEGNDVISGGNGDDVIIRSNGGFEQMEGGAGDDTLTGNGEGDMRVHVNGAGNGDVFHQDTGSFGIFRSIENFSADEIEGENDKIIFTDAVATSEISGLSDDAFGNFYPDGGEGNVVLFGPNTDYLLSDILGGTAPASGQAAVGPLGNFIIFGGDENGEIDGIEYENFETVEFLVNEDDGISSLMRSPEEEARIAEGAPVLEEEEEEELEMF